MTNFVAASKNFGPDHVEGRSLPVQSSAHASELPLDRVGAVPRLVSVQFGCSNLPNSAKQLLNSASGDARLSCNFADGAFLRTLGGFLVHRYRAVLLDRPTTAKETSMPLRHQRGSRGAQGAIGRRDDQ
jgi:hypothetical protein